MTAYTTFLKASIIKLFLFIPFIAQASIFHYRIREDLGSLDWGFGEVNAIVVGQLMEGLTRSDFHGKTIPAVAENWAFDPKKLEYAFKLRKNARWNDGKTVCAQDFVAAWKRVLSPDLASPYAHLLFPIQNALSIYQNKRPISLLGVSAPHCNRLIVRLEKPFENFPGLLNHWVFYPIREEKIKKFGRQWMLPSNLVTNGPYQLKEWKLNHSYLLERNPHYAFQKNAGNVSRIHFHVLHDDFFSLLEFEKNRLDWNSELPYLEKEKLKKKPEWKSFPALIGYYLGFRMYDSKLTPQMRCLLSKSLQVEKIPVLLHGDEQPAYSIVPPMLGGRNKLHAPKTASKMRFPPIKLAYYSKEIHTPLMEWISSEWKSKFQLELELVKMEGKSYWSTLAQNPPDIFLSGSTAYTFHASSLLNELRVSSGANWGKFQSKRYQDLTDRISLLPQSGTQAFIAQAETILLDDECAIAPLYFRSTTGLLQKKWNGFHVNPFGLVDFRLVHSSE